MKLRAPRLDTPRVRVDAHHTPRPRVDQRRRGPFRRALPATPTAIEAVREGVDIDCAASDAGHLRCAAVARLTLRNPTDDAVTVTLSIEGSDDTLEAPGAPATTSLTLSVAPHDTVVVTQRARRAGEIHGTEWHFRGFGQGALGLMHPLMAETLDASVRVLLTRVRATRCANFQRGWASVGEATVVTHAPSRWTTTIGWEQHGLCRTTPDGIDCLQVEETRDAQVSMSFDVTRPHGLRAGGIAVGFGATTPHGVRARLGYEFGITRRLLGAASVEGDVAGNVVLTPTVGYAMPLWRVGWWRDAMLPGALVLWGGAPVGVLPDRRVGVRAQASLVWTFAGLDAAVDYWPVDGRVDVSVMLRTGI